MSIFRRHKKETRLIVLFTCLKLIIDLLSIGRFGFQRDEMLHLALADHPALGYMEVPPFISLMSWLSLHLFGGSVFAVRILPSLFGSGVIYLTGLMTLSMGGKRFAIAVACAGMLLSPAFLASGYLLQPVVFDQFFWALAAFFLIQFVKTKKISYLYWLGAVTGLGMLNKYTMLLYSASLFFGMLVSGQRKLFLTKHVAGSLALALLIFLPNLLWQFGHHFPVAGHMRELKKSQLDHIGPIAFILGQLLDHATGVLIWLPGFIYLFFSRVRSRYIFISFAYLVVMTLLALLHGKVYYGFGAYPALFAAGGLCWQRLMIRVKQPARYAILGAVLLPALIFVPIAVPILPFPATLRFFSFTTGKLNLTGPVTWEDQKIHATTQDYADMRGWEEIAGHVGTAYSSLSEADRQAATIFACNYGQAGAIDHLGKKYDLPRAVCLNSSYKLWAPDSIAYQVVILVDDGPARRMLTLYRSVTRIGEVKDQYAREKGTAIYLLREPLTDVNAIYREHKNSD